MRDPSKFSRYRVTTFGEPADWTSCIRPCGINDEGAIVGCHRVNGRDAGFAFDGKLQTFDDCQLSYFAFSGIDNQGFAFGVGRKEATPGDRLILANVKTGESRVHELPQLDRLVPRFVSKDGSVMGDALFLSPDGTSRGFYGAFECTRDGLEIGACEAVQLTKEIEDQLQSALPWIPSLDRIPLSLRAKNANGQRLLLAVRVGFNSESIPILIEPDGSMRFALGESWQTHLTGSESTVLSDDGTLSVQAHGSVPPQHTVFWIDPDNCCELCRRPTHAVFREVLQGKHSLGPSICGCLSRWMEVCSGPEGRMEINSTTADLWVGEAGSSYEGALSPTTKEGNGWGVIWRRHRKGFSYCLIRDLIETPANYAVLGAIAINVNGQIACTVINERREYLGARLDPIT